jgi:hypothetical protein
VRLTAASTRLSNVKPHFQETADFACAIRSQVRPLSPEGNIAVAIKGMLHGEVR